MRIGMGLNSSSNTEALRFMAQLGVQDVVLNTPPVPVKNGKWELIDLVGLNNRVNEFGLKLTAIENTQIDMRHHMIAGGPRFDEQLENMIKTIKNIGNAGIPMYTMSWRYPRFYRTGHVDIGWGALGTAYDAAVEDWPNVIDWELSLDRAWECLETWVKESTPVAEKYGVKMGLHPVDPPMPVIGGVPQLLFNFENYKRLIDIVDSPYNSILLCQGSFSQMAGADRDNGESIYDMIEYFVKRERVLYVHFRNVSGTVPKFHETFVNKGHVDMYRAMRIYAENGFTGFFMDDHVPHTIGDTDYGHRAKAYANGYIQALIETVTDTSLYGAH
ncbi:MAG: mannonate dehydratase [Chloroflexi bacterium]|nr:mannonate dehydratase [Chloroflexota bacterium]